MRGVGAAGGVGGVDSLTAQLEVDGHVMGVLRGGGQGGTENCGGTCTFVGAGGQQGCWPQTRRLLIYLGLRDPRTVTADRHGACVAPSSIARLEQHNLVTGLRLAAEDAGGAQAGDAAPDDGERRHCLRVVLRVVVRGVERGVLRGCPKRRTLTSSRPPDSGVALNEGTKIASQGIRMTVGPGEQKRTAPCMCSEGVVQCTRSAPDDAIT